ncbi:STN and carboxypeptidase regulatory-like domain-containing protein [Larkinella sp. VNQ87]|uniref:STN and carboxypeptidase regulatory-like domain-containing protein n=1 Tax=Larkinella sp. VNQ87 TaxID=3400921 RepID=UPI003C10AD2F
MYLTRFYLCLIGCVLLRSSFAQSTPPLERVVSVDFTNERLDNALKIIGTKGQFSFAYNSTIINSSGTLTLRTSNTVRALLNQIFRGTITYKSRGNHIILQKAEPPAEEPKSFYLDGYITDRQTGQKISQVSIYEKTTLASTVTNPYGYYRIKLSTAIPSVRLEVRRKYYFSETVSINARQTHKLDIGLTPLPTPTTLQPLTARISVDTTRPTVIVPQPVAVAVPIDSTPAPRTGSPAPTIWDRSKSVLAETKDDFADWFKTTRQAIHDANLAGDTLYRDLQFSLFPFIGTNHTLSGRVINDYSLNLVGGYSLGVRKLEVGGFLNLVRGDVSGVQVAGFANAVGENTDGIQVAGFFNGVRKDVTGIQAAGFGNTVIGNVRGIQAAGFYNMTLGAMPESIQAAGFGNIAVGEVSGFQLAGFSNVAARSMNGFQLAGYGNLTVGNQTGFQLAGFTNLVVGELRGWQISGFMNYATKVVRGHQLSLVNVAISSETTPFGFFSYVHENGYRRLEISTDELMTTSLTFKTGVRGFYNIFTGGTNYGEAGKPLWSLGYGFGTAANLKRGWMLNFDLTGNVLSADDQFYWDELNTLVRLNIGIEKKLTRHLALAIGPTANLFLSDFVSTKPPTRFDVPLFNNGGNVLKTYTNGWVGFQAAFRICNP